jgi:hypothetical protein
LKWPGSEYTGGSLMLYFQQHVVHVWQGLYHYLPAQTRHLRGGGLFGKILTEFGKKS